VYMFVAFFMNRIISFIRQNARHRDLVALSYYIVSYCSSAHR